MGRCTWKCLLIWALWLGFVPYAESRTHHTASSKQKKDTHTVKPGETLYRIAKENGIGVDELLKLNPSLSKNHTLKPGQTLHIPAKVPGKPAHKTTSLHTASPKKSEYNSPSRVGKPLLHTVKKGETLYAIARKYKANVSELKKWNKLKTEHLKVGMHLIVRPGQKTMIKVPPRMPEYKHPDVLPQTRETDTGISPSEDTAVVMESPDELASESVGQKELAKQFRQAAAKSGIHAERGTGAPMTTTLGAMEDAYFVMHKTLPIGAIIKIKNLMNSRVVYAKVIGKLPETEENKHVIVRYTLGVKKDLLLKDGKCYVEVDDAE